MAPIVATLDELGTAWQGHMLARTVEISINGSFHGRPDASVDASFDFADIIRYAASSRPLMAGTDRCRLIWRIPLGRRTPSVA